MPPLRHQDHDLLSGRHAGSECQRDRAAGRTVYRVNGLIDDCGKIVGEGKAKAGWFDTSTLKEPYRIEGKKTMGLELAEQLGWDVPDVIFYPTGGGTGLIGMWKAFAELEAIGFIGKQAPAHGRGAGRAARRWCAPSRSRHRARAALGGRAHHRVRHPRAAGDRRFSDPARGARERRLRHCGDGREDFCCAERSRARGGLAAVPGRRATYAAYKQSLADGRVTKNDRVMLFNCATGLKYAAGHAPLDRQPIDYANCKVLILTLDRHQADRLRLMEDDAKDFCGRLQRLLAFGGAALADNFPSRAHHHHRAVLRRRPSDAMARILAERMKVTLGETVLVENVTGAGGSIGVGRAVRSPPDGYTISFGHLGTHVANGAIYKLGYDLVTDLEPVVLLPSNPMIIVSKNAVPAKSLKELLAWLKARPGRPPAPPARARAATSPGSISRTSPASSCNTCRIAAPGRR
jgi:hypothetical protein